MGQLIRIVVWNTIHFLLLTSYGLSTESTASNYSDGIWTSEDTEPLIPYQNEEIQKSPQFQLSLEKPSGNGDAQLYLPDPDPDHPLGQFPVVLIRRKRTNRPSYKVPTRRQREREMNRQLSLNQRHSQPARGSTVITSKNGGKSVLQGNYPGGISRGGPEQERVVGDFAKQLTKKYEASQKFSQLSKNHQNTRQKFAGESNPIFRVGFTREDKTEMMVGGLKATFTDGTEAKFLAVSGNEKLYTRERFEKKSMSGQTTRDPLTYKDRKKGYTLVNVGGPHDKPVYNALKGKDSKTKCNSGCAAQKLVSALGDHMKANPGLRVKSPSQIQMYETWWRAPKTRGQNRKFDQGRAVESCKQCKKVLPAVTKGKG